MFWPIELKTSCFTERFTISTKNVNVPATYKLQCGQCAKMKTLWKREACCLIECDWNLRSAKRWSLSLYSISEPRCLGLDGTPLLFDKPHWGSSGLLWENTGLYNRSLRHARHLFETCLDLLGERRGWCNAILSKFLVEKLLIHRLYPILLSTYYG